MSEEKNQKLKKYQKQRYQKAKKHKNNDIHLDIYIRQADKDKGLMIYD